MSKTNANVQEKKKAKNMHLARKIDDSETFSDTLRMRLQNVFILH